MTITLLHTAEAHRETFDTLRDRIAPDTRLRHVVRPNWLARAAGGVDARLEAEIAGAVGRATGPVICTCTTIGPAAERAGAMRVDWPMMQAAARCGGPVLLAYALDSAYAPALELLDRALAAEGAPQKVHPLPLTPYWPLFQAGEITAFAAVVAGEVRQAAGALPDLGAVVLAQVSMAGAAPLLGDLGVPVLTSPETALRAAIGGFSGLA